MMIRGRHDHIGWRIWIDGAEVSLRKRNEKMNNESKQTKAKERKTNKNKRRKRRKATKRNRNKQRQRRKANRIDECPDTAS
jgi:hypothetical protein